MNLNILLLFILLGKFCSGYYIKPKAFSIICSRSKLLLNRILVDYDECKKDVSSGELSVSLPLDDDRALHIRNILKLAINDTVRMGVINHGITDGIVTSLDDSYNISLGSYESLTKSIDTPYIDLILAVPRPLRLERLLPIIASLGIRRLYLIAANKVEKDYFGSHLFRRPSALNQLLLEGLSQASDSYILPEVHVRKSFHKFVKDELPLLYEENKNKFIAHPYNIGSESDGAQRLFCYEKSAGTNNAVIAIGPEGGWEDDEVTCFKQNNFRQITLGSHILRTDVAVTVTLGMLNEWLSVK